jgi:hypothetical protein
LTGDSIQHVPDDVLTRSRNVGRSRQELTARELFTLTPDAKVESASCSYCPPNSSTTPISPNDVPVEVLQVLRRDPVLLMGRGS